jgi:hypothetical protein
MREERELLKKVIQDADDGVMSTYLYKEVIDYLAQPDQGLREAFRAGVRYSAQKYRYVGDGRFSGNDVALFLEMEACELSDDDITKLLELDNE